jgi:hypothetical protein
MKNLFAICAASLVIAGCGGGGGGGNTSGQGVTPLEGIWIYASAGHRTGTECGLDIHGDYEDRTTVKFTGNTYDVRIETCLIISGNKGGFVLYDIGDGDFRVGGTFFSIGARQYNELDLITANDAGNPITIYTAYNITGNELRLTEESGANDGSAANRRQTGTPFNQPVFIKQ